MCHRRYSRCTAGGTPVHCYPSYGLSYGLIRRSWGYLMRGILDAFSDNKHMAPDRRQMFLRGPVPLPWLLTAGALPGKALFIGVLLWWRCGMKKCREVPLNLSKTAADRGISLGTVRRALRALEGRGVVATRRRDGRRVWVTILDGQAKEEGQ